MRRSRVLDNFFCLTAPKNFYRKLFLMFVSICPCVLLTVLSLFKIELLKHQKAPFINSFCGTKSFRHLSYDTPSEVYLKFRTRQIVNTRNFPKHIELLRQKIFRAKILIRSSCIKGLLRNLSILWDKSFLSFFLMIPLSMVHSNFRARQMESTDFELFSACYGLKYTFWLSEFEGCYAQKRKKMPNGSKCFFDKNFKKKP